MVNVSTTTTSYNDGKGLQSLARVGHVTVIRLKTVDRRIYPSRIIGYSRESWVVYRVALMFYSNGKHLTLLCVSVIWSM